MDWLVQKLDHVQDKYSENEYHDRVVRSIVNIGERINITKFDLTVKKLIDMVPILNTVLVDHGHTVTWHSRHTYDEIVTIVSSNQMFLSLFLKPMDEHKMPQIRITIWGTTIGFSANNMIVDIYALRDLVCLFIDLYKNIDIPAYVSKYSNFQSRNIYKFFKTVPHKEKHHLGAIKRLNTAGHNKFTLPIPPQPNNITNRWLITETIPAEEVSILKEYAKTNSTTVEDVMLAAYHKALANSMEINDTDFCIGRFFNARSHSKIKPYISWNNLHAVLPYSFKSFQDQDFALSIKEVDAISDFIRDKHLVMKACVKDSTKNHMHDDYFLFSYVRVTDDIAFSGKPTEIFFSLAARNVPYAALTFTESQQTIRICAVNYIDGEGIKIIDYITKMVHYYVQLLIHQIQNGIEINFAADTHKIQDAESSEPEPDHIPSQSSSFDKPVVTDTTPTENKEHKKAATHKHKKAAPVVKHIVPKTKPAPEKHIHKTEKKAKVEVKAPIHKAGKAVKTQPKHVVKKVAAKKPIHKIEKKAKVVKAAPIKHAKPHPVAKKVITKPVHKIEHEAKVVKAPVKKHVTAPSADLSNNAHAHWTPEQHQLVVAFKKYHGEQLVPVEGDATKVKYLIKGKNTYQKRSWAEIKKFVEYKTGSNK